MLTEKTRDIISAIGSTKQNIYKIASITDTTYAHANKIIRMLADAKILKIEESGREILVYHTPKSLRLKVCYDALREIEKDIKNRSIAGYCISKRP